MIRAFLAALVGFALTAGPVAAQNCAGTFPNTLTNGTNADATHVMADLTYLLNCINNLSGAITIDSAGVSGGSIGNVLYHGAGNVVREMTTSGSGTILALTTSPSFTTPVLGVAAATSINKVVITAPATSATLTILNGKTLTANNTLTIAGTDSTVMTFPATSSTVLTVGNTASMTKGITSTAFSLGTMSSFTIDIANGNYQYGTNNGAFTLTAPTVDGGALLFVTNGASAGAITFSGFTVGSNTGDPLTTTNGSKFFVSIARINGTSSYTVKALQ